MLCKFVCYESMKVWLWSYLVLKFLRNINFPAGYFITFLECIESGIQIQFRLYLCITKKYYKPNNHNHNSNTFQHKFTQQPHHRPQTI